MYCSCYFDLNFFSHIHVNLLLISCEIKVRKVICVKSSHWLRHFFNYATKITLFF